MGVAATLPELSKWTLTDNLEEELDYQITRQERAGSN